jgi:hypothetical protein
MVLARGFFLQWFTHFTGQELTYGMPRKLGTQKRATPDVSLSADYPLSSSLKANAVQGMEARGGPGLLS